MKLARFVRDPEFVISSGLMSYGTVLMMHIGELACTLAES
jgi:hypothetical protein